MDQKFLQLMLGLGILLFLSVFASKISSRYGIPILLIFIAAGMITGSEGIGAIQFHDAGLTRTLGTVALSFILFSGGLSTQVKEVVPVWREGVLLALLGVLLSTGVMAVLIHLVMGWGWVISSLLGAAISSTDAAAVFSILKTRHLHLRPKIQSTLELESGSNDPMAVFLTLTLIKLYHRPDVFSWPQVLMDFFIQMSLGGLAGWFLGHGLVKVINWLDLEFEGLYPVLTIAAVISIYAFTEFCGGNGFLAVYLAGLSMGEERYFSKKGLEVFHDGLAWLMQVAMFLALGLLVQPSELAQVAVPGIFMAVGLMLLARPLSVLGCLFGFNYGLKEILFVSWGGLRGAVPIILATYILVSGIPEAKMIFNLVFFIVILCMLIQGATMGSLARLLCVQKRPVTPGQGPHQSPPSHREFMEFEVSQNSPFVGQTILELHLPENVLVVLIHRQEEDFIPQGNTEIEGLDRLVCLADKNVIPRLEKFGVINMVAAGRIELPTPAL